MKKYDETTFGNTRILYLLLEQRRHPMSETQLDDVLQKLAREVANTGRFLCLVYPENSVKDAAEIHTGEIEKASLLQADGMKYLPLFTDAEDIASIFPVHNKNERLFEMDLTDMLSFLQDNPHVDAVVINPGIDDLVMSRQILTSLLSLSA